MGWDLGVGEEDGKKEIDDLQGCNTEPAESRLELCSQHREMQEKISVRKEKAQKTESKVWKTNSKRGKVCREMREHILKDRKKDKERGQACK